MLSESTPRISRAPGGRAPNSAELALERRPILRSSQWKTGYLAEGEDNCKGIGDGANPNGTGTVDTFSVATAAKNSGLH